LNKSPFSVPSKQKGAISPLSRTVDIADMRSNLASGT
jgi:hypothetical protein